jgi:hypothetical protein
MRQPTNEMLIRRRREIKALVKSALEDLRPDSKQIARLMVEAGEIKFQMGQRSLCEPSI